MMPYFDDGQRVIYCGKAEDVLPSIESASIDLTVTSPPYDGLRKYNGYIFDFPKIAKELYRVTKPGGVAVWVVADQTIDGSETGTSFRQALFFKDECGFNLHDTMIYRKQNGAMGSNTTYLQEFEFMFVLSKGQPKTVNFLRDRKNAFHADKTTPKRKSDEGGSLEERKIVYREEYGRRKNIWDYPVGGRQEIGKHPAPFPPALPNDHIRSWSNPGDLILDPMCGSGTTLKMAIKNGCRAIGIDISAEYCEIAAGRKPEALLPFGGKQEGVEVSL
jgi:DNA modification methylase